MGIWEMVYDIRSLNSLLSGDLPVTIWVYHNGNGPQLGMWAQFSEGDTDLAGLVGRGRQTSPVR